ncbi:hypothetical protein halTADL_1583 [Halohasta litchfieldiae]|jgi:hypothetical protein|uniref:Uncharacterized protein n=1 Tax=Halohasta litchfieldiae TaxID=1073996 RepID=A0A1H6XKN8_9EURY|nr:hypothetical protein halTADL_1583 [Halohasta litchfieldiae]SEJ25410.1 hypothetical protein SAMN05444271_1368 [Halohasta litchfieldiae]
MGRNKLLILVSVATIIGTLYIRESDTKEAESAE